VETKLNGLKGIAQKTDKISSDSTQYKPPIKKCHIYKRNLFCFPFILKIDFCIFAPHISKYSFFLGITNNKYQIKVMYWTLELASKLEDAPWPATKEELIDYATRSGAPLEVIENLNEIEDEGEIYDTIEDLWPDYPTKEDFLFNEDEY
jgi:hypothetical protein